MLKIITSTLIIFITITSFGAKINFITSLNEAKKLAKEENKIIFVDVMADWCGPCKMMINELESDEEVVEYFNENFINLKINEKYNRQFITKFNIRAYPTIMYLDHDAKVIESFKGFKDVDQIYDNATRINNGITTIHKYFNIKSEEVLDEQVFVDQMSATLSTIPKEYMKTVLHSLINLGMPFSKLILNNYPTYIQAEVFTKIYKELDGVKDQRLTEKFIICHLLSEELFQNTIEMKVRSNDIAKITGLQSTKILSFALAYREFIVYQHLGLSNDQTKLVNAKNLLNNYPETTDMELLMLAFTEVVKITAKDDFDYYQKLEKTFSEITTTSQEYVHHDIIGVLQYALGQQDKYTISIAKANELARSKGIKFIPLIKDLRIYLD